MSKMFLKDLVPQSETTDGMVLVYNKTNNPQTVTVNGHMLGAGQVAWVTGDDPVLAKGVETTTFRIMNQPAEKKQTQLFQPAVPAQTFSVQQKPKTEKPISTHSNKKRKPRKQ